MADKRGDLTISITADVDEAVSGLKAVQRELRKTTQDVRELESAYKDVDEALRLTKPIAGKCGVSDKELLHALLFGSEPQVVVDGEQITEGLREGIRRDDLFKR